MQKSPILVIGSTGKIGRRVVQNLERGGYSVRAGSRQSDIPFDWQDPSTWAPALRGVEAAYVSYYPDLAVPGAPAAIERLVATVARQKSLRMTNKSLCFSGQNGPETGV